MVDQMGGREDEKREIQNVRCGYVHVPAETNIHQVSVPGKKDRSSGSTETVRLAGGRRDVLRMATS
jgi:hypothetical protein